MIFEQAKYKHLMIAMLIVILSVQVLSSSRQKSVTVDEIMYIAAGYYHLKTGNFYFNMTNPPLGKCLAAFPLLFFDLKLPEMVKKPGDMNVIEQWKYSREFLYDNKIDADKILFFARLPILGLTILLALFVFLWSNRLYNKKAGICALIFFVFSPNILAHSRLATLDFSLTVFMFISVFYFWCFMRNPNYKNIIMCGIGVSLAMLTKPTGLFLFPIFGIFYLISLIKDNKLGIFTKSQFVSYMPDRRRLKQVATGLYFTAIIGIITVISLNFGYMFQGSFEPVSKNINHPEAYKKLPANNSFTRLIADTALEWPFPLPGPYTQVLKSQFQLTEVKKETQFFAGNLYPSGRKYFMVATFLLKTPIPMILMFFYAVITIGRIKGKLDDEILILLNIFFILGLFSYLNIYNAGLRYILPIYPLIHVITSKIAKDIQYKSKLKIITFIVFLLWYISGTLFVYPNYLTYFNEIIGGPKNGYKYMVQSNLDWGQDLKGLKNYMEKNDIRKIKLGFYGSADANYYDINYEYLPSVGLEPKESEQHWWYEIKSNEDRNCVSQKGIIAMSATLLGSPGWMTRIFGDCYKWLDDYEPVDQIGYSILIYDIP